MLLALAMTAQAQEHSAGSTAPPEPTCKTCRWLDLETARISTRFLFIDDGHGGTVAKQNQHQEVIEGKFKFDRSEKFTLNFGISSGENFAAEWNNTGWGGDHGSANLYLKRLYLAAMPVKGVEVQYGSFGFLKGESTAITSYADDGYVIGERIVIERPEKLFFDQVAVTYGYFGDYSTPNINKRYHRLKRSNYHQFLVGKKVGQRAAVSVDYTFQEGAETMREAVNLQVKELRVIDTLRVENYQRVDVDPASGFAVTGAKHLSKRLTVGGGFAQVDRHFGLYNSDAFFEGRRVFVSSTIELTPEFSISVHCNRAIANNFAVSNRNVVHLGFHYDLLKTLKRSGIF